MRKRKTHKARDHMIQRGIGQITEDRLTPDVVKLMKRRKNFLNNLSKRTKTSYFDKNPWFGKNEKTKPTRCGWVLFGSISCGAHVEEFEEAPFLVVDEDVPKK